MQAVDCVRPKVAYLTTKTIQTKPYTNCSSQVKRPVKDQGPELHSLLKVKEDLS